MYMKLNPNWSFSSFTVLIQVFIKHETAICNHNQPLTRMLIFFPDFMYSRIYGYKPVIFPIYFV